MLWGGVLFYWWLVYILDKTSLIINTYKTYYKPLSEFGVNHKYFFGVQETTNFGHHIYYWEKYRKIMEVFAPWQKL